MPRFRVPFHMKPDGYGLIVLCILTGMMLDGGWLGPVVGLLLVISLLIHEVGHMLSASLLRVEVKEFGLSLFGAYTRRSYAACPQDEVLIAVAGPLASFLLAMPLLPLPGIGHQIGVCNMALGFINLLPIPSSDGLRILRNLRNPFASPSVSPVPAVTALSRSQLS